MTVSDRVGIDTTGMTNHDHITIEWAPFRVRAGVTDAELRAAAAAIQDEFLARQPGFLRRELLAGDDGGYVDVLWWQDRRSAQAAMEQVAGSAACSRYFALMDGDAQAGAGVQHLAQLASYRGP